MTKFTTFLFIGFSLCGCVNTQSQNNSLNPNSQGKEWNELFDSKEWQPVNNEQTIENLGKKAM